MLSRFSPALDVSKPEVDESGLAFDRENSQEQFASPLIPEHIKIHSAHFVVLEV